MPPVAPVNVARLRHQVVIYSRQEGTPDASGQRTYTLAAVATTRAEIGPVRSGEVERAHSFGVHTNTKVTIRYRPGITAAMQVVYQGRTLLINGVLNPDERNILLELYCQELI